MASPLRTRDAGSTLEGGSLGLDQIETIRPPSHHSKTLPNSNWIERDPQEMDPIDLETVGRTRPRVFPYTKYMPYDTETQQQRVHDLDELIKQLYIAVSAGDFNPGAVHWTREIRGWMSLKFDLTRRQRNTLARLYYELALAPGLDQHVTERFANVFMTFTKKKHYWRQGIDLTLDWRPLYKELKAFVLPESFAQTNLYNRRNIRTLAKICSFAQYFFDPKEIPAMIETILPYFSMSNPEQAFAAIGLINLLFPASAPPPDHPELLPQHYLPTFFHLWSTMGCSVVADHRFLDLMSRVAFNCLHAEHVSWSEYGVFSEAQSSHVFTSILRLLEVPVGQASSPFSPTVDVGAGLSVLLDKDQRRHPTSNCIARFIVTSLSPACLTSKDSVLHQLEALIQSVETFFHPSNYGPWARGLSLLAYYLGDCFVLRWNREQSGEYSTPPERRLNAEIKRRFVLCLREVVFMGIFAKSETAMNYSLSTLQSLAYLEPSLILPGALQRIYPAMQGLVEVHRTVSSIRSLQMLSRIISRTKGFRCHLTTLLGLALPGIDANDLDKTMHSLSFIQAVCYNIPLHKLGPTRKVNPDDDEDGDDLSREPGTEIAIEWITAQIERFERDGAMIDIDYDKELSDEEEELILRSSTAGIREFLSAFLGRVFTLLQNLPDTARIRSGSPEENIVNTLPATFSPLLATMSSELYDVALEQIAKFVANNVVHQARDAMAFICNALVKVSPKKALARLLPGLIANIRSEIDENGAGSTRTTGSEILPRDRALVWNISLLSMCVVHVGADVLDFKKDLFDIASFMQGKCRGIPLVHVSNCIHHLLLNLSVTYTMDYSLYDAQTLADGLTAAHWGNIPDPRKLNIKWHVPTSEEIDFAIELYQSQAGHAIASLQALTSDESPVNRDGTGKDWSDEVSRHLVLLRLIIAGCSSLFRSEDASSEWSGSSQPQANGLASPPKDTAMEDDVANDQIISGMDEEVIRQSFQYSTGYPLQAGSTQYIAVHKLRHEAGETLHRVHAFLMENQEDDVTCFNSLYTAYKAWFIDVGIERSAHVLDRLTRLFAADVHPFRLSGIRKAYPRPLLVKRANLYHFQRLRHKESPRVPSDLDKTLLADLAQSSVSTYTDIRRNAQSACEAAVKCIIGGKPMIIPYLLDSLEAAVDAGDIPRIKGAIYSLLMGSLAKPLGRYWKFTPRLIQLFLRVSEVDRPSIQKLVSGSQFTLIEMCKASDKAVILDREILRTAWPGDGPDEQNGRATVSVATTLAAADELVEPRQQRVHHRSVAVENAKAELGMELVEKIKHSHWKKASRTALMVLSLDCRFDKVASSNVLELTVLGTIDQHPSLRQFYMSGLLTIFNVIQVRAIVGHKYENYLLDKTFPPNLITVPTHSVDEGWTDQYLQSFAKPEAEYYVDTDYPGWLVWSKKGMHAFETDASTVSYDDIEKDVRATIAKLMNRHWFSTFFDFMKQEPRDTNDDHLRVSNAMVMASAFELVFANLTPVTFEDIKDLTRATYGDGSDKHQHRATAEIMLAMLTITDDCTLEVREKVWEYVFPVVRKIFQDGLTPENLTYWTSFVNSILVHKDPRRYWPLVDWLASFRLDMTTNTAFKESSKISLLNLAISTLGWHFQLEKPILEDFLAHLDHPYKQVREVIGTTLSTIFFTRFHESYKDVETLLLAQKAASSIGVRPYQPSDEYKQAVGGSLEKLEQWRKQRQSGTQALTPYTQAAKTILTWLDQTLYGSECGALISFLDESFIESILHMMDVKEDPELQSLAYQVFRQLPNIPFRRDEDDKFVAALIRIARTSTFWHQRLRVLINLQVIYFRQLFFMSGVHAQEIFDCVREMLHDAQLEVRLGAAATISGMIRCSAVEFRERTVSALQTQFTQELIDNPMAKIGKKPRPKREIVLAERTISASQGLLGESSSDSNPAGLLDSMALLEPGALLDRSISTGTPTPEHNKLVLARHAAVLGLGALVQAFPYISPPPKWLPEVLATLAGKASGDPGLWERASRPYSVTSRRRDKIPGMWTSRLSRRSSSKILKVYYGRATLPRELCLHG